MYGRTDDAGGPVRPLRRVVLRRRLESRQRLVGHGSRRLRLPRQFLADVRRRRNRRSLLANSEHLPSVTRFLVAMRKSNKMNAAVK